MADTDDSTSPEIPPLAQGQPGGQSRAGKERDGNQDGPLALSGVGACCNSHTSHEQGRDAVPLGSFRLDSYPSCCVEGGFWRAEWKQGTR